MSDVKFLKLITGEEVIAETKYSDSEKQYTLKNPILLIMRQSPDGQVGSMMIPYAGAVDNPIDINSNHVMFVSEPRAELVEKYSEAFSAVEVPKKGLLLPTR